MYKKQRQRKMCLIYADAVDLNRPGVWRQELISLQNKLIFWDFWH